LKLPFDTFAKLRTKSRCYVLSIEDILIKKWNLNSVEFDGIADKE